MGYSSRHIAGNVSQQATHQLARVDGVSQWHLEGAFALGFVTQIPGYGRVCWTYLWAWSEQSQVATLGIISVLRASKS